jgi:hypothetical protein
MRQTQLAFLIVSLAALGCGASHGQPRVITYTWRAEWGPCTPMSGPCYEQFAVTRDGAVSHDLQGMTGSAQLTGDDVTRFDKFLDDSALGSAIGSPACCAPSPDRTEAVTLSVASAAPAPSKNVVCCTGAEYDLITQWTSTLESYFATPSGRDASTQ